MAPTAPIESVSPSLQDDQKFTLMKFRRSVADIIRPSHDDYFLVRWLKARNWNPAAAEKMLRDSMKWRERMGVDDIDKWPMPRALKAFSPHGLSGFDKDGSPVIIISIAGLDLIGQLHAGSRADYHRGTLKNLEHYMGVALEQSRTHGPGARQLVILFDVKDFNLRQYTWRPASEVVINLLKTYEANYPEILKVCYLINVPKVFHFVFNIVRKFLDEHTINKIAMFKTGSTKWQEKLFQHCDRDQVPAHFGGTQTDPDGDPRCVSKINYGGIVPESWYLTNCEVGENPNAFRPEDFTEATVKKGCHVRLEFRSTRADQILRWEFRTYDHDIKFGVHYVRDASGEQVDEVELARVAAHQLDEIGFVECQKDCTYVVTFDNSYSYFTTKRIRYAVQLAEHEPLGSDEPELAEATEATGLTNEKCI